MFFSKAATSHDTSIQSIPLPRQIRMTSMLGHQRKSQMAKGMWRVSLFFQGILRGFLLCRSSKTLEMHGKSCKNVGVSE